MSSNRLVQVLLITVAVVAAVITAGTVAREVTWRQATAEAPEPDYLGDPASLRTLDLPAEYEEIHQNTFQCLRAPIVRCYATTLRMHASVMDVQRALSSTDVHMVDGRLATSAIVCGSVDDTSGPVVAVVTPRITNARRLGVNSWRIPEHPRYDGHLVVRFQLTNHSGCGPG